MSAAVVILPVVWAYAESETAGREESPVLGRKGPRGLRLVRAGEEMAGRALLTEAVLPEEAKAGLAVEAPVEVTVEVTVAIADAARPQTAEIAFYRDYTEAMLRRCLTMSMEEGRVSSLLGRELFRGNVSNMRVQGFEDVVIYVHDVETCIAKLDPGLKHLVRRIALQGYTQAETAAMLGITLRTITRRYAEALDALTRMFLAKGLMRRMQECGE